MSRSCRHLFALLAWPVLLGPQAASAQIVTFEGKLLAIDKVPGADRFGSSLASDGSRVVVGAPYSDSVEADRGSVFVVEGWAVDQELQALDGAAGDRFGESVALSGTTVVVGVPRYAAQAGLGGAVYVYDKVASWTFTQKITPPVPSSGLRFGTSVAIYGDTLVVGATGDDEADTDAGAAYVYRRTAGTWTLEQKLLPAPGDPLAGFGCSVAAGLDTLLVGSYQAGPTDAGAAYVFAYVNPTWTLQGTLTAADASPADHLGWSVALSQDTALVGAPLDDSPISDAGSAYVFARTAGVWAQQQRLVAGDATADDQFGNVVSVSGNTAVVGSVFGNALGNNSGAGYAFVRSGTTWSQQQKLNSPSDPTGDDYGIAVTVSGDVAWVGAPKDDPQGVVDAGTVYQFQRSGTAWAVASTIVTFGGGANDACGATTAVSSQVLALGCDQADVAAKDGGAVYVWDRSGVQVVPRQVLLPPNPLPGLAFGYTLAADENVLAVGEWPNAANAAVHVFRRQASGQWLLEHSVWGPIPGVGFASSVGVDGDLLAVGATGALNGGGVATGGVYLFRRYGAVWLPEATLFPPDGAAGDVFGVAVDVDAAQGRVVVGAPWHGGLNVGGAYVFERVGGSWSFARQLSGSGRFGRSIALSGPYLAVGAPERTYTNGARGGVSVFAVSDASLLADLSPDDLQAGDQFGYAVALDGDVLVAGAFANGSLQGVAYVFERSGSAWVQRVRATAPDGAPGDYFGHSVAVDGRSVFVGAPQENQLGFNAGAGYRYAASGNLSATKTNGLTQVNAGQVVTYAIQVQNSGPSLAAPTQLVDGMPAQCSEFSWTCTPSGGATCTGSGFGSISDTVSLPPGGSLLIIAQCLVSTSATGTLSNTVSLTPPYGWIDPDPTNNSATDSDPITPVPVELQLFLIE